MVSALLEDRAVRTSEVQDPETGFGQHCTVARGSVSDSFIESMQLQEAGMKKLTA
jgi:hypothetical protein